MTVIISNSGSYPRVGEGPDRQRLRRTVDAWERGEVGIRDLRAAEDDAVREALEEQARAGIDLVTDGQVSWYDPVSHLLRGVKGVEIGGLLRFFDTNTYFRQPIIRGTIRSNGPIILPGYRRAVRLSSRPVKPILTGPYTLAALSVWRGSPYRSLRALALALAKLMGKEVAALSAAGAQVIQIDEPAILKSPGHLPILRDALRVVSRGKGRSLLCLQTYFADASPVYDKLQSLPADILGLDLTYGPTLLAKIGEMGSRKPLCLGIVDGRNTKLEDPDAVAGTVKSLSARLPSGPVYLSPSCGLEYLPRERAFAKLALLKAVKDRVEGQ